MKNNDNAQSTGTGKGKKPRREIQEFEQKVKSLKERGFSVLAPAHVTEISNPVTSEAKLSKDSGMIGGAGIQRTFGLFDEAQSHPQPVEGAGTKDLGFIPWGTGNMLPNLIFNLVVSLPYTASAIKYIIDLTVGYGPSLMYPCVRYSNGSVQDELVPYNNAGVLIMNRIREVRALMAKEGEGSGGNASSGKTISWQQATGVEPEDEPEVGTLAYELKQLLADYKEWERTKAEVDTFVENNNLLLHYMKCMTDDAHMDIYFPTVGLSIGRVGEEWDPKIVKIGHLPAVCTRMEEMDEKLRINYVYYSEKWRQDATAKLEAKDVVAYPTLMPENMLPELRRQVRKNQTASLRRRPTWFCCPNYYPSMLKPYYPQPAWWSIFPSKVYEYASTLITDKAVARQNATMWGKMIFIHNDYMRAMFVEKDATTPEEMEAVRNQIFADVNSFLQRRENNGKTIMLDMFTDQAGRVYRAIEIVDVPQVASGADTKDELEEISSIIFFAIGVHPALIGAVPGKSGSSGGTFQRELHLLKQSQVSPRQRIYLRWLQNIHVFNKWDKKGVWVVREPVLTTLDRNKTGIEESDSK